MNDPNDSRRDDPWAGPSRGPYPPGPGGPSSPWDPWNVGMWMEPWMQMFRMWTDGLSAMTPAAMAPWVPGVPHGPRDTTAEIGVSVQVQSRRPARVTLKMDGSADARYVSVGPLAKQGQPSETLTGVRLISRPDHCLVQVSVPDVQAPGVYVGTVEDRQRRAVGELSVSITGDAQGGDSAGADEASES